MSEAFQKELNELAATFARNLLAAVVDAKLGALEGEWQRTPARGTDAPRPASGPSPRASGRAVGARRDGELVDELVDELVRRLQASPQGVRAEELRAAVGAPKEAFKSAVRAAIAAGRMTKRGERRSTVYGAR